MWTTLSVLERFYLETVQQQNGLKKWLQARVVGLPLCWSRILGFNVVKSTRGVLWVPSQFVQDKGERPLRSPEHMASNPRYPDPLFYVSLIGKYLLRSRKLSGLRVEQFNRYFLLRDARADKQGNADETMEDTIGEETYVKDLDCQHRNFNPEMESLLPGAAFPSAAPGLPSAVRRMDSQLGVNRMAFLEPLGDKREGFYEQKLLAALAWCSPSAPTLGHIGQKEVVTWVVRWCPPNPDQVENAHFEPVEMQISSEPAVFSFEEKCRALEDAFSDPELNLVCPCCTGQSGRSICRACTNGIGWHYCACETTTRDDRRFRWKPGSLHAGVLDIQRVLYNMHRRNCPTEVIEEKATQYATSTPPLIPADMAKAILDTIRAERGPAPVVNDGLVLADPSDATGPGISANRKLGQNELEELLAKREALMQAGGPPGLPSDQFRVYDYIKCAILDENGPKLRLMVRLLRASRLLLPGAHVTY